MHQVKPNIDCAEAVTVVLAGKEWFIPMLAVRQNRVVVPNMLHILPFINAAKNRDGSAYLDVYSEDTLDRMAKIVHAALTRAYAITLDEFLDLPVSPPEFLAAMPPILRQTAFFSAASSGAAPAGEEDAAIQ